MTEYQARLIQLKKLKQVILENENDIKQALYIDLGKSYEESYMTEIGPVLHELTLTLKHLKKWMKIKKVKTPLASFPAKSYIIAEPFGKVLIMGPWNYPFQLIFSPLVGSIAAGNTVVIKPSEYAVETEKIVLKIIKEAFTDNKVLVRTGDYKVAGEVLDERFDYIFFTGSEKVGKIVMEKASKHLTPLTLELGGKSPAIIDENKNMQIVAKRLAFGKLINAGQTCIAPDYLLIREKDKVSFVHYFKEAVESFYGKDPLISDKYPKIINAAHKTRLEKLMANETVLYGGKTNDTKISPTILEVTKDSLIMQEEIFGPLLPIITYETLEDAIKYVKSKEKPLALYLFSDKKNNIKLITESLSYGGATINDTLMHFTNENLGFGGVGYSGMGKYHGKYSFETFTHYKPVLQRGKWLDIKMRYLPISSKNEKKIKRVIK